MKFSELRSMPQCRWSARRLHRYLDRDPSALLTPKEESRLTHHLEVCDKCTNLTDQIREISKALREGRREPDVETLQRITGALIKAIEND